MQLKHLSLEISTLCNSGCITCPQSLIRDSRPKRIDKERILKLIDEELSEFADLEYVELHNYNEPLIDPNWFFLFADRIVNVLGPKKIGIVTNGSTITPSLAERILNLKPHHVWFSVDGYSEKTFNKIRPGLSFERVAWGIQCFYDLALENEFPLGILFTVTPQNEHEVESHKKYWTEQGNFHIYFQYCDGRGAPDKEAALSEPCSDACDYVLENAIILTDLHVTPCCIDWQGLLDMGSLENLSLKEIWDSANFDYFRRTHLIAQKQALVVCRDCRTALKHGRNRYVPSDDTK